MAASAEDGATGPCRASSPFPGRAASGSVCGRLAQQGWTMVIVTYEIRFAQQVADQVLFIDEGVIAESGPPDRVLTPPTQPRTRQFLQRILDPL